MSKKRKVEIFSAGCPVCRETIEKANQIACPSCEVVVLDMANQSVSDRASKMGIRSLPAVVVDGRLAGCCAGSGPDEADLRAAGLGQTTN
jgi:glutaredoxin 3